MISLKQVSKWYGSFQVLTDCSTEVAKGEVVVVCGPSGSGKSTLIKCVNALEPFQKGEITVEGISVGDPKTDLPKLRSRIGMVFQNFELFPHMTVTQNLTLGQVKVLGRPQGQAREKGLKLLERVGLIAHKDKYPGQLSGGQQQRVALARSLITESQVLLLDEPLSALDPFLRVRVREELKRLQAELGVTFIHVTHSQEEALALADMIVVMDGGQVQQAGPIHLRPGRTRLAQQPVSHEQQIGVVDRQKLEADGKIYGGAVVGGRTISRSIWRRPNRAAAGPKQWRYCLPRCLRRRGERLAPVLPQPMPGRSGSFDRWNRH